MNFAFIVVSIVLFGFSTYLGFYVGNTLGERAVTARDYWKMNGIAIVVAVLVSAIIAPLPLLYAAVIGALAGTIVGLKMSFGESVGPWKTVDRFFGVNKGHQQTAESGKGEERRRRRKTGEEGPALISVEDKKIKGGKSAGKDR